MGLRDRDLLRSIWQIWNLISTLGLKVLFQAGPPSMTSWALEDWDHVSRSMTVMIEQESGEACPPASSIGSFLANAGLALGSRLHCQSPQQTHCHRFCPQSCMRGPVEVAFFPVQSEGTSEGWVSSLTHEGAGKRLSRGETALVVTTFSPT